MSKYLRLYEIYNNGMITATGFDAITSGYNWTKFFKPEFTYGSETQIEETLFNTYVWPKYYDQIITYCEDDMLAEIKAKSDIKAFIYERLQSTKLKYAKLIALYADLESDLLKQIESSQIVKFNDTPQDGGNFDDDDHTSTSTRTESSTDVGTPLQRLEEVRQLIRNYYSEWAKELIGGFVIYD